MQQMGTDVDFNITSILDYLICLTYAEYVKQKSKTYFLT